MLLWFPIHLLTPHGETSVAGSSKCVPKGDVVTTTTTSTDSPTTSNTTPVVTVAPIDHVSSDNHTAAIVGGSAAGGVGLLATVAFFVLKAGKASQVSSATESLL